MNISVRMRLFLYMTVGVVTFALLLYGVNAFFIEGYYIKSKKESLLDISQEVSKLIENISAEDFQDEDLIYTLNKLEKITGTALSIGKADGTVYFPAHFNPLEVTNKAEHNPFFQQERDLLNSSEPSRRQPPNAERISWDEQPDGSVFITMKDPRFAIETLRYQYELNDLMVSIWIPMTAITESAEISNRFTLIVALITVLITAAWALFISGRFTKPIKEINRLTKEMSNLNFSQKLKSGGKDEIGQLSESINHLSERLASAINELDSKNRQLENDIDRERKLDKLRREFVSSVTHELKTPIFLIQGYAEGLKNNIVQETEKKEFYCDVIIDEAGKMDMLVKDLLDISQIESGAFSISKTKFDIVSLVKEVVHKFAPTIEEKNIKLEVITLEESMIFADPIRIEQILVNYLNNAIDHVDIKNILRVEVSEESNKARVSVFNSGHSIPADILEKIWESFYKADKARTRKNGGMGMGLAIVKAIQEAHHNLYGARNLADGVEFWFYADIAEQE